MFSLPRYATNKFLVVVSMPTSARAPLFETTASKITPESHVVQVQSIVLTQYAAWHRSNCRGGRSGARDGVNTVRQHLKNTFGYGKPDNEASLRT